MRAIGIPALLSTFAFASEARADWLAPVAVAPSETTVSQPQIAVDAAGDATAVWTTGSAADHDPATVRKRLMARR